MSTRSNESPATKEQIIPNGSNGHTPQVIPPLQPGDFLTRAEFERRYHNHPDLKKAELIEGIVYMP
ncbi:MAG: hypothetical protein KDE58_36250, partial [Caldilineaceae bacterium]|nr:hypothetical protein [Caldilineaceae bacterium]